MTHVPSVEELRVKIFSDGADLESMRALSKLPYVAGFTTNPTLMRKTGVTDYEQFAREILDAIRDRPISFEVTSDDFSEMERQARKIATRGSNVYVKIPVTNTRGEVSLGLIRRLAGAQIPLNVTAILTLDQVRDVSAALAGATPSCISVFAGRIADTRDPVPIMTAALDLMRPHRNQELIWASPRELRNIFHADPMGCQIVTVTGDLLAKLAVVGKDLREYSLETVAMFRADAVRAGYSL